MEFLKTAPFGALAGVTFVVGATFYVAFGLVVTFTLVADPASRAQNGVPQLLFPVVAGLAFNAAVSVIGAGLWMIVRRFLPSAPP